jgi:hypothetical protein
MQLVCSPACTPTSPTKTSTSSEPAWAKWNMMELFMTDRHQHLPAATMLHVLDSTPLRHSRTSQCGRAASSRRAAAAARRSARGPHAPRSGSLRARSLAPPPRATRAPRPTGVCHRAKLFIYLILSYLILSYLSSYLIICMPCSPDSTQEIGWHACGCARATPTQPRASVLEDWAII